MHARPLSIAFAALLVAAAVALPAHAQGWKPDRNVELIIPAGAGGSLDNTGRTINRVWDAMNLVPVPTQIINRSGGGHAIAYAYLNQRQNEPNIVSITSATILINHINGRLKVTYTDFTPLAGGRKFGDFDAPNAEQLDRRVLVREVRQMVSEPLRPE